MTRLIDPSLEKLSRIMSEMETWQLRAFHWQ